MIYKSSEEAFHCQCRCDDKVAIKVTKFQNARSLNSFLFYFAKGSTIKINTEVDLRIHRVC